MRCQKFDKKIFNQYIDNDLNRTETKNFGDHLVDCIECRRYFNELKAGLDIVRKRSNINVQLNSDKVWVKIQIGLNKKIVPYFRLVLVPTAILLLLTLNFLMQKNKEYTILKESFDIHLGFIYDDEPAESAEIIEEDISILDAFIDG